MARTVRELAIEVCDRVTVNTPDTIFGNNDRIARNLRIALKDTIREIMRLSMKNGVSALHSQWIFATKPGIYAYRTPPDFHKMIPGTEQRNRWPLGILGPVNPQTWSNWISGLETVAVPMGWRIKNNLMHFEPVPQAEELIVIEYISRFPAIRDATPEDMAPVDGRLEPISPLVPREGYVAKQALDAVDVMSPSDWGVAQWGTALWGETPLEVMRRIPYDPAETNLFPPYQVRKPEFDNDNDICAFDDDHVISLGMTWRLRKGLRMDYAEAYDEYERETDVFLANDASRARTFSIGEGIVEHEVAPLGDGQWSVS